MMRSRPVRPLCGLVSALIAGGELVHDTGAAQGLVQQELLGGNFASIA